MTIHPRELRPDRHNPTTVWLNDDQQLRVERLARQRNVTCSTMLAIMIHDWFDIEDAIEVSQDEVAGENPTLTVPHPDVFDVRENAAAEHDGNDVPAPTLDGLPSDLKSVTR